jgi:hypothetical protein
LEGTANPSHQSDAPRETGRKVAGGTDPDAIASRVLAEMSRRVHDGRMAEATHVTVTTLRRDLSKEDEQHQELQKLLARGFDEVPGFVSGLWTFDRERSEVVIIHSFDSLDAAQAFADHNRNNTANRQAQFGLELLSVRVNEVIAAVDGDG